MKKKIRQVTGTTIGITFTKEEREIHDLKIGKIIDLSDMVVEDEKPTDFTGLMKKTKYEELAK